MNIPLARKLLLGLAAGDALGSTSEFQSREMVLATLRKYQDQGWPYRQVGGGAFDWKPGDFTDDTALALAILRGSKDHGFNPKAVALEFVAWYKSGPRDIGGTTRHACQSLIRGTPWRDVGLKIYRKNPQSLSNGSLMRNGIVPALTESLEDIFEISLKQGIITNYAPLCVACCAFQCWVIINLHDGTKFSPTSFIHNFVDDWSRWVQKCRDPEIQLWRKNVTGAEIIAALSRLKEALEDSQFDPFKHDFTGNSGFCVTTLQVAWWALKLAHEPANWKPELREQWSALFPGFDGFKHELKGDALALVPLVGHDADTNAACAGPMIAAAHPIPKSMTDGLQAAREFDDLFGKDLSA
jgi:ADP-ribosylglycohydrolase